MAACEQAWREAARLWERAAERETHDGRRQQYAEKAEAARAKADEPQIEAGAAADDKASEAKPPTLLN